MSKTARLLAWLVTAILFVGVLLPLPLLVRIVALVAMIAVCAIEARSPRIRRVRVRWR